MSQLLPCECSGQLVLEKNPLFMSHGRFTVTKVIYLRNLLLYP